jgi:hypothetical protein
LPISKEELWSSISDYQVLGHLPDHSALIAQFGNVNAAECFWYPSPALCLDTILSWSSAGNSFDLMAWFFSLTCTINCGTLYRQVCAFPNHVQPIEFTTGGRQSRRRNIKNKQWKKDATELNFKSHCKGPKRYVYIFYIV